MIVSLVGGGIIHVTEKTVEGLDKLLTDPKAPKTVRITTESGHPMRLTLSSIAGLWPDEVWDDMQHEKAGDFKCGLDHWHKKGEHCSHYESEAAPPPEPSFVHDDPIEAERANTTRSKWMRLIQLNNQELKSHGKYGTLRRLDQLEQFEINHEWPPPPEHSSGYGDKETMVLNADNKVVGRYKSLNPDGTYAKRPGWVKAGKLPGGQEQLV